MRVARSCQLKSANISICLFAFFVFVYICRSCQLGEKSTGANNLPIWRKVGSFNSDKLALGEEIKTYSVLYCGATKKIIQSTNIGSDLILLATNEYALTLVLLAPLCSDDFSLVSGFSFIGLICSPKFSFICFVFYT